MKTKQEITNYLDSLKPEELKVVQDHLDSIQWTQKVQWKHLATNLQATESKEVAKKSLEFEEDTFKIDSTGWKEEVRTVDWEKQKVKVSPQGDVLEYMEWLAKGEQLFITYANFINYVAQAKGCSIQEAEQKYLLTREELQKKMKGIDYTAFYNSQIKGHLAGFWGPNDGRCSAVGERSGVWLAGGHTAAFAQHNWSNYTHYASFGFSGRLLKN